jgi:RNA polymerase subunit RPABC4/transcription elongation factor Spt4
MVKAKGGIGAMHLRKARLCLDCEEIFEDKLRCPRCDSETWHPIMGWIRPMSEANRRVARRRDILVLTKRPHRELLAGNGS